MTPFFNRVFQSHTIKKIKYIVCWATAFLVGVYLLVIFAFAFPQVQKGSAYVVSRLLGKELQTNVSVENLRFQFPNRLVMENFRLNDRSDTVLLKVKRMSVKLELRPLLLKKQICIAGAQLIGADVNLYQKSEKNPYNFQFLLDAFSSKDTTKSNINLRIKTLLLRRCNLYINKLYEPLNSDLRFHNAHIRIQDLDATASLNAFSADTINLALHRLNLKEQSGLQITEGSLNMEMGKEGAHIGNLHLSMPHSALLIPEITVSFKDKPFNTSLKDWLSDARYTGRIDASLTPADIQCFLPKLQNFTDPLYIHASFRGEGKNAYIETCNADFNDYVQLRSNATITGVTEKPKIQAFIQQLKVNPELVPYLTERLNNNAEFPRVLKRLGDVNIRGNIQYALSELHAQVSVENHLGHIHINGTLPQNKRLEGTLEVKDFHAGALMSDEQKPQLGKISLSAHIESALKDWKKNPNLSLQGILHKIEYKEYPYHNVNFQAGIDGKEYHASINLSDLNGIIEAKTEVRINDESKNLKLQAKIKDLYPAGLNLTKTMKGKRVSTSLNAEISGHNLEDITGYFDIDSILFTSEEQIFAPGHIYLRSEPEDGFKRFDIESPFLNVRLRGDFQWKNLKESLQGVLAQYTPILHRSLKRDDKLNDDIAFSLSWRDTSLLKQLFEIPLSIPRTANINGRIKDAIGLINLQVEVPELLYGKEIFRDINAHIHNSTDALHADVQARRQMKGNTVLMGLYAQTSSDSINTRLFWNNEQTTRAQIGEIDLVGHLYTSPEGQTAVKADINPSNLIINDSIWTIHPASVRYQDHVTTLKNLNVSKNDKFLEINGNISDMEHDSVIVDLHQINLGHIFNLINFHAVDFDGDATGRIYARNLTKKPNMEAFLQVHDFTFNKGKMGELDLYGNIGQQDNSIWLSADIRDTESAHHTSVEGTITPGKGPNSGIDLNIHTSRCNLFFLNKYTSNIFTDLNGRTSGTVHIFGPFKKINLEGALLVNEAELKVNSLGTRYLLKNDSVKLEPNHIYFRNARVYDEQGSPESSTHYAIINGDLRHEHLNHLTYDIDINAFNILGYDFRDFGDNSFYGTIYADGNVKLKGEPGNVNVALNGSPSPGSIMVYNVTTPETLTKAGFIDYVTKAGSTTEHTEKKKEAGEEDTSDMRLDFNLNITPNLTMRLLMDQRTGDYIDIQGNSHILANYYNKGRFQIYGTYHVDNGIYKLSIQDVIRKDFQFQPGGTILFGGNAMQASLDLKASYMVPNVSLDDLSPNGLGLSNTRVDCIMNITGRPSSPIVTFDFELPNANEDERQMIRSILSTEEERNMQVIYLLGIGRFYSYSNQYVNGNNQSATAMNSLISSTLSSQFNQILSNAMGNNNWSFGANLRTNEDGWDQLDVEGILSGRLLNNRLLINGNFGYRESYYSTNNFIGDFDVQYMLNQSRNLSLKAYNKTNDRYFIQSSLTTQGIGIQFKKDFNRWKELFYSNRKIKKKKNKKSSK